VGGINGNFILQDMYVYVDVAEGEGLRLGIRADGRQSDGTLHPEQKNGWFKVDYFRICKEKQSGTQGIAPLHSFSSTSSPTLYTLDGRPATTGHRGILVEKGQKRVKK
jgi:hypothetical protein